MSLCSKCKNYREAKKQNINKFVCDLNEITGGNLRFLKCKYFKPKIDPFIMIQHKLVR